MNGYLKIADLIFCEDQTLCNELKSVEGGLVIQSKYGSVISGYQADYDAGYTLVKGKNPSISAYYSSGVAGAVAAAITDPGGETYVGINLNVKV
ncbi:MAG: hypothetical protein Kow0049_03820 [Stanieria sp.]